MSMIRLFAKRGVRLAPFHTARQHPSRRTFYTAEVAESPELSEGQIEAPGNANPYRLCSREPENHLWERVEKLDDRVADLSKDLGNFKGDVGKAIGELQRAMEKRFGELNTAIETSRGDFKAEIQPIVWQVRMLLGGVSLVVVFLVNTYLTEHNIFTKKQPSATPPISRAPTQVVSSRPAGIPQVGPRN